MRTIQLRRRLTLIGSVLLLFGHLATLAAPATASAARPSLYLTFDDGPDPIWTPQILDLLDRYNAKATFFVVGSRVGAGGALINRIIQSGHALGNHSWMHEPLNRRTDADVVASLEATTAAVDRHGYTMQCMRPPYGAVSDHLRAINAGLGLTTLLWDIDTFDWKRPGVASIVGRVGNHPDGKDVLLHDGGGPRAETVAAVAELLAKFSGSYNFASLPVCASAERGSAEPVAFTPPTMNAVGPGLRFRPATPRRLIDTRTAGIPMHAGETRRIQADGPGAAAINLTAVNARDAGYLTAWNCDASMPSTSSNNVMARQTRAVGTVVGTDATGGFCVFSSTTTDLIVDVTGRYTATGGDGFHSSPPTRLFDSRGGGAPTASGPIRTPVGATAVSINVTVVDPSSDGFLTAYGCSSGGSNTSTVNFRAGQTIANFAQIAVDAGGLCLQSDQPTHVIVDLTGWYGGNGDVLRIGRPVRVLDTRDGTGGWHNSVSDGQMIWAPAVTVGGPGATALLSTMTAVEPRAAGFLQAWACTTARPLTSVLNTERRVTVPNTAIVPTDSAGKTCLSLDTRGHLLFDVIAWFEPSHL